MLRLSLSYQKQKERKKEGVDERERKNQREKEPEKEPAEGWPKGSNNEAYLWPTSLAHLLAKQLVTKPDPVARKHT